MKLLAKLSAPIFFAILVPLTLQAQGILGTGRKPLGDSGAAKGLNAARKVPRGPQGVALTTIGGEASDTTVRISADSAAAILKATHSQVLFLDGVRSPKKNLVKVVPDSLFSIELAYGDPLIRQYGNDAKEGVVTVVTKTKAQEQTQAQAQARNPMNLAKRAKPPKSQ